MLRYVLLTWRYAWRCPWRRGIGLWTPPVPCLCRAPWWWSLTARSLPTRTPTSRAARGRTPSPWRRSGCPHLRAQTQQSVTMETELLVVRGNLDRCLSLYSLISIPSSRKVNVHVGYVQFNQMCKGPFTLSIGVKAARTLQWCYNTVLIEINGVTCKLVAARFWSDSIVLNETCITSAIAELSQHWCWRLVYIGPKIKIKDVKTSTPPATLIKIEMHREALLSNTLKSGPICHF